MKKFLLIGTLLTMSFTNAQNILTQSFDDMPAMYYSTGWVSINSAITLGSVVQWTQGAPAVFSAYAGSATNAYAAIDYTTIAGPAATISTWLVSPTVSLQNGDIIKFWTRTVNTPAYPDRLQVRLSTTPGANPTTSAPESLGGFTNLLLDINPTLTTTGYPNVWTEQTITVSGLTGVVNCQIGLRYYVTNGGSNGTNSEYIGLDSFTIDRPLSVNSFNLSGVKMYPNPTKDILYIQSTNEELTKISITDLNGRIVKEVTNNLNQISLEELAKGMYMVTIESATAKKIEKLIVE